MNWLRMTLVLLLVVVAAAAAVVVVPLGSGRPPAAEVDTITGPAVFAPVTLAGVANMLQQGGAPRGSG